MQSWLTHTYIHTYMHTYTHTDTQIYVCVCVCIPTFRYKSGRINEPETDWSGQTEVHIIYDVIPKRLVMLAGEHHVTWTFLTSVHVLNTSAIEAYKTGKIRI